MPARPRMIDANGLRRMGCAKGAAAAYRRSMSSRLGLRSLLASTILALTLSAPTVLGASGRVVRVADGDSFEIAGPDGPIRVRLYGVDAPEHGKPYWSEAKKTLSDLIYGRTVELDEVDRDRYGRVVARVRVPSGYGSP